LFTIEKYVASCHPVAAAFLDHWLAITAREQPELLSHLHALLLSADDDGGTESAAILLAQLNLVRVVRQQTATTKGDSSSLSAAGTWNPASLVHAGLVHARPELRTAALAALCRQPSSVGLPGQPEVDQLIEFLETSVAEDDSRFRQEVESALGALLLRLRDRLLVLWRAGQKNRQQQSSGSGETAAVPAHEELQQGLAFLDRLQRSLVANLRPGGNYQRYGTGILHKHKKII
jgi:hypothetical protein